MSGLWVNRYVGLPYAPKGRDRAGCDCWGLAMIIYHEELHIRLPAYRDYTSDVEQAEIAALVAGATTSPLWLPVEAAASPFDIAIFRRGRMDTHVGVIIQDGTMIHLAGEDCSKIENYTMGSWSHRLTGIYRHAEMASRVAR
jgi:cell wall-associated NlpC family hydrolase